jgi:hypothetical protein
MWPECLNILHIYTSSNEPLVQPNVGGVEVWDYATRMYSKIIWNKEAVD